VKTDKYVYIETVLSRAMFRSLIGDEDVIGPEPTVHVK